MEHTVTLSVVNSGTATKEYRKNSLTFIVAGGATKSVTITLPDDADFLAYIAGDAELASTITYGQNDPRVVEFKTADYTVDQLDGTIVMTATVPKQILLPLASTMFTGDAAGGVGNIIQIVRASSGALNVQTTSPDAIDGNAHVAGVAGYLTGGTAATTNVATWVAVTDGEFAVTIDGVGYNITGIDFSAAHAGGAVASMAEVAARIQAAVRAATGATETVVWSTDHFVITSSVARVSGYVSVLSAVAAGTGTDISGAGATTFMDGEASVGVASAGVGGYAFTAAGSIHIQAVNGGWRTVGGTTAFS